MIRGGEEKQGKKAKRGSNVSVGGGKTPKDYPRHLFCDKNTSLEVQGRGGKTLCEVQEKLELSGTLEAPSLQERTEEMPLQ